MCGCAGNGDTGDKCGRALPHKPSTLFSSSLRRGTFLRTAFSPLIGRKVADPSTFYSSIYPSRFLLHLSLSLARSLHGRRSPFTRDPFVSSHSLPRWTRRQRDACLTRALFLFIATTPPRFFSSSSRLGVFSWRGG